MWRKVIWSGKDIACLLQSRRIIGNAAGTAIDPEQSPWLLVMFQHCISSMLTPSGAAT
jgi:hypothetical protein